MSEEFVTIKQDPQYEINKDAVIRNKETGRVIKSRRLQRDGYYHVMLGKYQHQKSYLTHRLLAEAFLPNPENCKWVSFRDHVKTNIELDNLFWTNNVQYEGVCKKQRRVRCVTDGKVYKSISAACRAYGVSDLTVRHSCIEHVVSSGLQFEFIEDSD